MVKRFQHHLKLKRAEEANMAWTKIRDIKAFKKAKALAKGTYQLNLLLGIENLSGSTLRGRAREYSARYARSRNSLLRRMSEAGIPWTEKTGPNIRCAQVSKISVLIISSGVLLVK